MSDEPHPADSERDTPKSIEMPPELRAAPSERAAAILLELAQLRGALEDLRDEIRRSLEARHEADDARFTRMQGDLEAAHAEIKRLDAQMRVLEKELQSVREEYWTIQKGRSDDKAEREQTTAAIKAHVDQLRASYDAAKKQLEDAAAAFASYQADSQARNLAFLRFGAVQSVMVEDLGYELDKDGIPIRPDKSKPTKLTLAAEASKGTRAAIVLLMLQIIWQVIQAVTGGVSTTPPRPPPTFERAP